MIINTIIKNNKSNMKRHTMCIRINLFVSQMHMTDDMDNTNKTIPHFSKKHPNIVDALENGYWSYLSPIRAEMFLI